MRPIVRNDMQNDHDLIHQYQNGNRSAYDEIVRRHLSNTIGFFYTITGDRMAAEDLAQDVFLKLFRTLRDFASNLHSQPISIGSMLTLQIPGLNGINGRTCSTWIRYRIGESGILNWNRNGPGKNCGMRLQNSLANSGLWL